MSNGRGLCAVLACLFTLTVLPGCSGSKRHWYNRPRTSQQCLDLALEGKTADDRREGVIGLAQSRDATADWAIKVFDTVARTDTDTMVRCTAVRAMLPSAGPQRVPTLLKLLGGGEDVRSASGPLRWEAAKLLQYISDRALYDDSQIDAIVQALLDRLTKDPDRNVKLTAIETLAYFPRRPVPGALIDAMEADDYAIKHAAERTLVVLTGVTHDHDATAWRQWLAATDDPFKHAGELSPDTIEPRKKPWWERGWEW